MRAGKPKYLLLPPCSPAGDNLIPHAHMRDTAVMYNIPGEVNMY